MSDAVEEFIKAVEKETTDEAEAKSILLTRMTDMLEAIRNLSAAVARLEAIANQKGGSSKGFTVTERDEYGQIKSFMLN